MEQVIKSPLDEQRARFRKDSNHMAILPQSVMNYTNLRLKIRRAGYDGSSLAQRIGMPARTLNSWMSSGRPMPADVIVRIAKALHMEPEEILEDMLGMRVREKTLSEDEILAGLAEMLKRYEQ